MLPTLVLTAQSAVIDPVEMHACRPTLWFSMLFFSSRMLVRLEITQSRLDGVTYLARARTSFCKSVD
jgi:hypothetical protein